jgi:hypothetical protein
MKVLETGNLEGYLGPGAVGDSRDVVNRFTSPGDCRSPGSPLAELSYT